MKHRKHNRRKSLRSLQPKLEQLECKRLLAGDVVGPIDEPVSVMGSISGTKWEDVNRNAERDANESGLAGVTIYIDANNNGEFDRGERSTVTRRDNPATDFDEGGMYAFRGLEEGRYWVREVVPNGFVPTYPNGLAPDDDPNRRGHLVSVEQGEHVRGIDFGNHRLLVEPGGVRGTKWEDLDGDGERDPDEPGLPGVVIYSDLNRNRRLDRNEPFTRTSRDIPETDFDEGGMYEINGLRPGDHVIREIVPEGYRQTFPSTGPVIVDVAGDSDGDSDEYASVRPNRLDLNIAADDYETVEVAVAIHPLCFAPVEVDVVASNPDVRMRNLSGVQLNGCGGDVSRFEVAIASDGTAQRFSLVFVNRTSGERFASIPVTLNAMHPRGAHHVTVPSGETVEGLDFGNRPIATSAIEGSKWLDINGDGLRDVEESGIAGVAIYLDLNGNRRRDRNEPATVTSRDNPSTPEDETGRYRLGGLRAGEYVVREVIPEGYEQTFPGIDAEVLNSRTGSFNPGIALDLDITDAEALKNADRSLDATIDVTVVWPNTCGTIKADETEHAVIGNHVLIELSGHQVGDLCAEVITPEVVEVDIPEIRSGRYDVIVTLQEDLSREADVPTLYAVGRVALGGNGQHVVTLGVNETVEGVDFGNRDERYHAVVQGTKWLDRNGDGVRQRHEPGIAGVTVYSDRNFNGELDRGEPHAVTMADDPTTRINEAGHYWLENLWPGEHLITEVLPAGFERTFPLPTGEGGTWPENDPYFFDLKPGEVLTSIDFGNHPMNQELGVVSGFKWSDLDNNGHRESDEPGLAGVTIYLDANLNNQFDLGELATRTMRDNPLTPINETGMYLIEGVRAGFYIVREIIPPGFIQTFPEEMTCLAVFCSGRGHAINVDPGQSVEGLDFGNHLVREPASIHGLKWLDRNGNGERERNEPGLAGVTIFADINLNGELDRGEPHAQTRRDDPDTRINETGMYQLNVRPGEHLILEVVPDGYRQTYPNPQRRIAFPFNLGHRVDVSAGDIVRGIDFGNQPRLPLTGAVEGMKWLDRNGNGERERNEPGLSGVVIYSDINNNGRHDADEPTTRTQRDNPRTDVDERGLYRLDGLAPGRHVIREVIPRGFVQTAPHGSAKVGNQVSEDLPPGRALSFELIDAGLDQNATGGMGLGLTFKVVWPNGCGTLIPSMAEAKIEGDQIRVELFGTQEGVICTQALEAERQRVFLPPPPNGEYRVEAVLNESRTSDGPFFDAFKLKGEVVVRHDGHHRVSVQPGKTAGRYNFGNRPIRRFETGDFDMNGNVADSDIDLLAIAIRAKHSEAEYDLTGDGELDDRDYDHMVKQIAKAEYGDANLDGVFDSTDLVQVFKIGKYEDDAEDNAGWADGDWNGDGDFDSTDLVHVFQHGNYEAVDALFGS